MYIVVLLSVQCDAGSITVVIPPVETEKSPGFIAKIAVPDTHAQEKARADYWRCKRAMFVGVFLGSK